MARQYITTDQFRVLPLGGVKNASIKDDALLERYIEIATVNVEQFTERIFESATYVEIFRGDDSLTFLAENYPILTVVSIDDITPGAEIEGDPASLLVRTTINNECGRMELVGKGNIASFSSGSIYRIVYTAGYDPIPLAVQHATALWVTELLQPDYLGPQDGTPALVPASSQQISDLLVPLRRRRI
jgi:hypothetical protein